MLKTVKLVPILTLWLLILLPNVHAQDEAKNKVPDIHYDARGVPMVYVPSGQFEIGISLDKAVNLCEELRFKGGLPPCNSDFITESRQDPEIVDVKAFYLDQYEVSRADYVACVDADVCGNTPLMQQPPEPLNIPVQYATYYDAAIYCAWREARIPTKAEWEYASRGLDSFTFPWGNEFNGTITNHCDVNCRVLGDEASLSIWDDGYSELAPIDAFKADQSWIGAYNLGGNILEWTSSRSALNQSPSDDLRVIKGGSYDSYPYQTAGWFMTVYNATQGRANIGFRCVRTTNPE